MTVAEWAIDRIDNRGTVALLKGPNSAIAIAVESTVMEYGVQLKKESRTPNRNRADFVTMKLVVLCLLEQDNLKDNNHTELLEFVTNIALLQIGSV
jgi:hypothetical protein